MIKYSTKQVAQLLGLKQDSIKIQLQRDYKKPFAKRRYPHAHKCECGSSWLIPVIDIKK